MAFIRFEDIGFAYAGQKAPSLEKVSFSLPSGAYACVCGKSGSGKTTLLQQLKPSLLARGQRTGMVSIDGSSLDDLSLLEQASRVGFVAQDPDAQLVCDTVWRELAFGLESLGVKREVMRQRVAETASFFGMQPWFDKPVLELSGGQRQVLNLASTMVLQPDVLVLDEPTSQLDPIAAQSFLSMVHRINQELGVTVILSEHRLEEVLPIADSVLVLEKGHLAFQGSPAAVVDALYAAEDDMTLALPTSARVFHGVEGSRVLGEADKCPLSVREGRAWLEAWVQTHGPLQRFIDCETEAARSGETVVRLKDLWFRYEKDSPDVLRGVDLAIESGSIFALVGGNGAGKTTLLKTLCGVAKPYRGSIEMLGAKLKDWKRAKLFEHGLAMLPQDPKCLFAKDSVRAELTEMLDDDNLDESRRSVLVDDMLERCQIAQLADENPYDLSGGEQQCVALAKVLLTQPRLLLLDEPTKGMDAFLKQRLAQLLEDLRDEGASIVIVSHDVEFCARHADKVGMLFDGEVTAVASTRAFFSANSFYTTAASRMSRGIFEGAVTDEDVIELCLS